VDKLRDAFLALVMVHLAFVGYLTLTGHAGVAVAAIFLVPTLSILTVSVPGVVFGLALLFCAWICTLILAKPGKVRVILLFVGFWVWPAAIFASAWLSSGEPLSEFFTKNGGLA